jgi:16S rRNA (guanine(527)-N(7))-methyltransferase RsmG
MTFSDQIQIAWPTLSKQQINRICVFYQELVSENTIQNLTRLISPLDFIEGHLLDVRAGLESGLIQYPALDLGSGGGVPGLLAGLIDEKPWILVESEQRKAEFLKRVVEKLSVGRFQVVPDRIETALPQFEVGSIVVRAVGKIEKIYGWIRKCSTWNTVVLFKGPGWEAEWKDFQRTRFKDELRVVQIYPYEIGTPLKHRVLIQLERARVL